MNGEIIIQTNIRKRKKLLKLKIFCIAEIIAERRQVLADLEEDLIDNSDAPGTRKNTCTKENRYMEFCEFAKTKPFPVTQFKISKFATFLSFKFKSVDAIKGYCTKICQINELRGFKPVKLGLRFQKLIAGLRRTMAHEIKQAEPMTVELLEKISEKVNEYHQKQLAIFTLMLFGFFLFLRKSNLVLDTQVHDMVHNLSRSDIRYQNGVLVIIIKWSKMIQFFQKKLQLPIVADKSSKICPVKWLLKMIHRIPAHSTHNLFSYMGKNGITLVTYTDLTTQMRQWLKDVGVKDKMKFSSHSLRRGGTTHAFNCNLAEQTLKVLGNWASESYRRYIDLTVETRLRAWFKLSKSSL